MLVVKDAIAKQLFCFTFETNRVKLSLIIIFEFSLLCFNFVCWFVFFNHLIEFLFVVCLWIVLFNADSNKKDKIKAAAGSQTKDPMAWYALENAWHHLHGIFGLFR